MHAYKFLKEKYGLSSLKERRLKQSRISELNDPFELAPYDLSDPVIRKTFLQTREGLNQEKGLLCFSADWSNPVIWAHYSDSHKGLCLGFEIQEMKGDPENDETDHVDYQEELFPCPNFEQMSDSEYISFTRTVLFTKFKHWLYEKEIRVWGPLQNEENGLHFVKFGENLKLTEVIVGARSTLARNAVEAALGSLAGEVKVTRARAAYDKFEMVVDETFT